MPLRDRRGNGAAVFTDPHDRGADDDFFAVFRSGAVADRLPETHLRHLVEQDRRAFAGRDDGAGRLADIADARVGADREAMAGTIDQARADPQLILLDRKSTRLKYSH